MTESPLPVRLTAEAALNPYFIVTPPYTELSAGIRALHWLCDALNRSGGTGYVAVDSSLGPLGADPGGGLRAGLKTPVLTTEIVQVYKNSGLTPIVIYPETKTSIKLYGLTVFYMLNYIGILGGFREPPACDYILAYSENIRLRHPVCDDVLFIPGSDWRFWTPDNSVKRRYELVYAGKYVDYHGQRLPLHLRDALQIHRYGTEAPTKQRLRDMFRSGTKLYVFENTAVAAEAALCGCPVVVMKNWFFDELIAEKELGLKGFALDDSLAAFDQAKGSVSAFRADYEAAACNFALSLQTFITRSQELARNSPMAA